MGSSVDWIPPGIELVNLKTGCLKLPELKSRLKPKYKEHNKTSKICEKISKDGTCLTGILEGKER